MNSNPANLSNTAVSVVTDVFHMTQSIETRQLGSKQDHVATGTYEKDGLHTYWAAAFDGHGDSIIIETIRSIPLERMNEIMADISPAIEMQKEMDSLFGLRGIRPLQQLHSGSTMVYAKVVLHEKYIKVQIGNVGDSQACLFVNGMPIFVSEMHDCDNGKEMVRLLTEKRLNPEMPVIVKGPSFEVFTPDTVASRNGRYLQFQYKDGLYPRNIPLSPSQTLGHCGITGLRPDVTTFTLNRTDAFKIILVSDGITDVMPLQGFTADENLAFCCGIPSAKEVVDEAERRWKQDWKVFNDTDVRKAWTYSFPVNGCDDCCCAMLAYGEKAEPPAEPSAEPPAEPAAETIIEELELEVLPEPAEAEIETEEIVVEVSMDSIETEYTEPPMEEVFVEIPLDDTTITIANLDEDTRSPLHSYNDEGFGEGEIAKEDYRATHI
jgi:serine/threonine protein phosphatase PrpC